MQQRVPGIKAPMQEIPFVGFARTIRRRIAHRRLRANSIEKTVFDPRPAQNWGRCVPDRARRDSADTESAVNLLAKPRFCKVIEP
jgi:hypothetical protein